MMSPYVIITAANVQCIIHVGAEDKEDECQSLMTDIEKLKSKKAALELEYHSLVPQTIAQQTLMIVCDICGSFLSALDSEKQIAKHVQGSLHSGVVALRQKLNHLQVRFT